MSWQFGVTLYVRDADRSAAFYRALGLDVSISWQYGGLRFLVAQPRTRIPRWRIVLAPADAYQRPDVALPPNLVSLTVFPEGDDTVDAIIARIRKVGGKLVEGPSLEPVPVAVVSDPDGHHIVIGGT